MDAYYIPIPPLSAGTTAQVGQPLPKSLGIDTAISGFDNGPIPQKSSSDMPKTEDDLSDSCSSDASIDEDSEVASILKRPRKRRARKTSGRSNPVGGVLRYFSKYYASKFTQPPNPNQDEEAAKKKPTRKPKKSQKQGSVVSKQKYVILESV